MIRHYCNKQGVFYLANYRVLDMPSKNVLSPLSVRPTRPSSKSVRPSSKRNSRSVRSSRPDQGNGGPPKRIWDHNDMKLYKNSEQIGGLVETEEKMYSEVKSLLTERLDVLGRMRHELKEGNALLRR